MVELDHISLIISSEKNLQFYEKLGFTIRNKIERKNDTVVFMECGRTILEIFIDPTHPKRINDPETMGLRHIAFIVERIDDIDFYIKEIGTDFFGRRYTFITDPDGQPIELIEKGE